MATVLITGGHAGIGFECAKQLASRSSCDLILAGRSLERMEPAAQDLRTSYGVRVTTLKLDTSSLASVREAAAEFRTLLDSGKVASLEALLAMPGADIMGRQSTAPMVTKPPLRPIVSDISCWSSCLLTEWQTADALCLPQVEHMIQIQPMERWLAKWLSRTGLPLPTMERMARSRSLRGYATQPQSSAPCCMRMNYIASCVALAARSRRSRSTLGPSPKRDC